VEHTPAPEQHDDSKTSASVWLILWLTMLIYGAIAAPIPGVNEPHYLGKAKHFWNPAWCPDDLLLESSNAHYVFYFTVGFWSQWLSLPMLAIFARGIGYGLLARGWQRTTQVIGFSGWQAWLSCLGFLSFASWGNFSGEWLVGGIEGKTLSYACLLLAFAGWQTLRPARAAVWAGLAISFHPVVGAWAVLAALLTIFIRHSPWRDWKSSATAVTLLLLAALPGLIPAISLIFTTDSADVRINGTYLQVYYRLAHHLDPMKFSARSYWCYAGLCLGILLLRRTLQSSIPGCAWLRITGWSVVFAAAGLAVGYGPRPAADMPYYLQRMTLLKFYPFRLFDVLIPLTVALQGTLLMTHWLRHSSRRHRQSVLSLVTIGLVAISAGGLWRQSVIRSPTIFDAPEWRDVCSWAAEHMASDALIQTPIHNSNFKWHAGRAEYVTYKDVPQDNRGLVEWNRRMRFLAQWYRDHASDGYSAAELQELRAQTDIDYIITDRLGPFELPPCYTNARFRVYDLTQSP